MVITLELERLRPVFGESSGSKFLALFSRSIFDLIRLTGSANYDEVLALPANANEIPEVIKSLEGPHHIFCITADAPFRSPPPDTLANAKLGVLPMFSTGFSISKLEIALQLIFQIDYQGQYQQSRQLLGHLADAGRIVFKSEPYATTAILEMNELSRRIYFFNQSGPIGWGRQSVLPNGEVSLLTNRHGEYSREATFALDGELVFHGYPVLHRGSCPCLSLRASDASLDTNSQPSTFRASTCPIRQQRDDSPEKQERFFANLVEMNNSVYLAHVKKGVIENIQPLYGGHAFGTQLMEMFDADDNYRKIHELGFGLNSYPSFFSGNFLPNEMRRGVHFGLGLTPYSEFHLDLVCTPISVSAESATNRTTFMDIAAD